MYLYLERSGGCILSACMIATECFGCIAHRCIWSASDEYISRIPPILHPYW